MPSAPATTRALVTSNTCRSLLLLPLLLGLLQASVAWSVCVMMRS